MMRNKKPLSVIFIKIIIICRTKNNQITNELNAINIHAFCVKNSVVLLTFGKNQYVCQMITAADDG